MLLVLRREKEEWRRGFRNLYSILSVLSVSFCYLPFIYLLSSYCLLLYLFIFLCVFLHSSSFLLYYFTALLICLDSAVRDAHKFLPLHNGVIHPSYAPTPVPVYSYFTVVYTVSSTSGVSVTEISKKLVAMNTIGVLSSFVARALPTISSPVFSKATGTIWQYESVYHVHIQSVFTCFCIDIGVLLRYYLFDIQINWTCSTLVSEQ